MYAVIALFVAGITYAAVNMYKHTFGNALLIGVAGGFVGGAVLDNLVSMFTNPFPSVSTNPNTKTPYNITYDWLT